MTKNGKTEHQQAVSDYALACLEIKKDTAQREDRQTRFELLRLAVEIAPKPRNYHLVIEAAKDFEVFLNGRIRSGLLREWKHHEETMAAFNAADVDATTSATNGAAQDRD